jgi:hypothetical protein
VAFAATGRPPFGASERAEALLYRVVHGSPDLAGLPVALDGAVRAAVAPDPAHRPAPDDLLRLLLPGAPDPYRAATTALRDVRPGVAALRPVPAPRRRTALTVTAGVLAGVAIGGAAGFWWLVGPGAATAPAPVAQPTPSATTPVLTTAPAPAPAVPRLTGSVDGTAEPPRPGTSSATTTAASSTSTWSGSRTSRSRRPRSPSSRWTRPVAPSEARRRGCAGTQMNLFDGGRPPTARSAGPAGPSAARQLRRDDRGFRDGYGVVNLRAVPAQDAG